MVSSLFPSRNFMSETSCKSGSDYTYDDKRHEEQSPRGKLLSIEYTSYCYDPGGTDTCENRICDSGSDVVLSVAVRHTDRICEQIQAEQYEDYCGDAPSLVLKTL